MRKLLIAYTILTSSCLFSCKNETAEPAQKAMQTRDSSKNSSLVSCGNNLKPELLTCVETHSNNAENLSAMCSIVGSKVQTNSCDKSKFKRFCTQTFQTETNGVKTKWSADVYFPESNSTFCAGSKDLVANKQGTSNPTPPTPSPVPTPPNPSPTQPGLTLEQTEAAIKSYTVPFSAKAPAVRDLAFSREMYLTAFTKLKALKITYDALG